MTTDLRQRHARVRRQLDRMIELASDPTRREQHDPKISGWSVALQIEHLVRVLRGVGDGFDKLARGEGDGPASPKPIGRLILFLGWIPRGRAKVPERVQPQGVDAGELAADLAREKRRFDELDLEALDQADGTLPHPVFGPLTARRWLRFLEVHNHHHLKIVGDVLQSSGKTRR